MLNKYLCLLNEKMSSMHDETVPDKITCWQQEADERQTANPETMLHQ